MKFGNKEGISAVPKHNPGKVLTSKYLASLESSISARTPVAGMGVSIMFVEGGSIISVTGTPVVLNVCENGEPSVVTVFGYTS